MQRGWHRRRIEDELSRKLPRGRRFRRPGPPIERMLPSNTVSSSYQTMTSPPSPSAVALASRKLLAFTCVPRAAGSASPPWNAPPTRIAPPPASPRASRRAPSRTITSPVTVISPPTFGPRLRKWRGLQPALHLSLCQLGPKYELPPHCRRLGSRFPNGR